LRYFGKVFAKAREGFGYLTTSSSSTTPWPRIRRHLDLFRRSKEIDRHLAFPTFPLSVPWGACMPSIEKVPRPSPKGLHTSRIIFAAFLFRPYPFLLSCQSPPNDLNDLFPGSITSIFSNPSLPLRDPPHCVSSHSHSIGKSVGVSLRGALSE